MDRFILTFHNNTLFVLDPEEGKIIGVLSLQCSISGLAASGGHIFLLCQAANSRKIIKLSIHPSLVKLRSTPVLNAGRFAGNLSAASSRAGSREALDQLHVDKDSKNDGRISPKPNHAGKQREERMPAEEGEKAAKIEDKLPPEASRETDGEKDSDEVDASPMVEGKSEDVEKDGATGKEMIKDCGGGIPVEEAAALVEKVEENEFQSTGGILEKERSLEAKWLRDVDDSQTESEPQAAAKTTREDESRVAELPEKTGDVDTTTVVSTDINSNKLPETDGKTSPTTKKELESEKESSSVPEQPRGGKSIIPTLALAQGINHVKADLKEIKGALKLGKLTEFISHHSPTLQRKSDQHSTYSVSNDVVRLSTNTPSSANKEVEATPTTVAPPTVDPEEQQRRLRMAEMVVERDLDEEDVVVATNRQTKARKTRKRRTKKSSKHSSAASESVDKCNHAYNYMYM